MLFSLVNFFWSRWGVVLQFLLHFLWLLFGLKHLLSSNILMGITKLHFKKKGMFLDVRKWIYNMYYIYTHSHILRDKSWQESQRIALERQRKTATALFANLNGGRDENWSLATSCGLDAFERGGGCCKINTTEI